MNLRLALCNEVLEPMPFAEQCARAAALGYRGLEVAPYTLAAEPHRIGPAEAARIRTAAEDHGIAICGLHWLLVVPQGLSITSPDAAVHALTIDVMRRLVALCAALGGRYLVHGSPKQRLIEAGQSAEDAWARARAAFAAVADDAEAAGVVYCIEPLSPDQTPIVNTLAEAARMVREVDRVSVRSMLDASSAGLAETEALPALVERWLPTGLLAHVQLNDRNRRGPGQGTDRFAPLLSTLLKLDYTGWIAVEPFDYVPDGQASAARAIGYIQGLLEGLGERTTAPT